MTTSTGGTRLQPRAANRANLSAPSVAASATARKPIGIIYALSHGYGADVHLILPWTYVPLLDGAPGRWCPRDSTWRVSQALSPMVVSRLMIAGITVVVVEAMIEHEYRPPNGLDRWGAGL
jgi:hypothetical protein